MCCQDGETLVRDNFLSMEFCLCLGLHLELGTAGSPGLPNNVTAMWGNGPLIPRGDYKLLQPFGESYLAILRKGQILILFNPTI